MLSKLDTRHSLSFGQQPGFTAKARRVLKCHKNLFRTFHFVLLCALGVLAVQKNAQMTFKLSSQNISIVSGTRIKKHLVTPFTLWLSSLLSTDAFFQQDRLTTARAYSRTVIPVSPQGKTGISLTLARAKKDEIPALRFAWPE